MAELAPPRKSVELEDPGAHELEASDSEEHFSDASEGRAPPSTGRAGGTSPVPTTRVERVDDEPSYGEVPGTEAYKMRTQDAVPDEVEVIPDGQRSRSTSHLRAEDRPVTPGGTPIPKMVVEKVDPEEPSHGEVPGTLAYDLRKADAEPDEVLKAPDTAESDGIPTASSSRSEPQDDGGSPLDGDDDNDDAGDADPGEGDEHQAGGDGDDFGDDFDDFEEGEEAAGDDDFGDFDDGFQQGVDPTSAEAAFEGSHDHRSPAQPPPPVAPPLLDFNQLQDFDRIYEVTQPYLDKLFPPFPPPPPDPASPLPSAHSIFLSDRSVSLWSQLVAPPPLQPSNWIRSRIRRLFLVSLGVPVDLDEILPASKQKKLVLPSSAAATSRSSSEHRKHDPSAPADQQQPPPRRKGPPPPPDIDLAVAIRLCATTVEALFNFTDVELRAHLRVLGELQGRAEEALRYWTLRREEAVGDKEAFEGVIANLVEHAKRVRK